MAAALAILVFAASCSQFDDGLAPDQGGQIDKTGVGLPNDWLSTPRLFTSGVRIGSLAVTPSRLLASTLGPTSCKLVQILETGDFAPFAPGFQPGPDAECILEVSPATSAFTEGQVIVGVGSEIDLLASDGNATTLLATLPASDGEITGLTFDTVGSFNDELLVLTTLGSVFRVDANGRTLYVGTVGAGGRGPAVAPARFGRFAGTLLIAFPAESEVRSLDAAGGWTTMMRWSGVTGVCALPDEPRAFGATGGALFFATATGSLYKYPVGDLAARGGALILNSAYRSGSGLVTAEPGGFRMVAFSRSMGEEVAAASVQRPTVTSVTVEILPGVWPKAITLGSTALVPVGILASTGFVPAGLQGGDMVLAGAHPVQSGRSRLGSVVDLNGDGRLDLVVQFRPSEMQLTVGDATLALDATLLVGDRVRGATPVLVLAP